LQQARMSDGRTVAEHLADQISAANATDSERELGLIGAVVGATLGREAADLAARLPNSLLLVPGIGAQGATIGDVRRDFGAHYPRLIPSLSRAIARGGPRPQDLRREVERRITDIRDGG